MGAKRVTKVTEDGKTLTTTFTYKIKDAVKANYQLATSPDDKIVIIWRVTVATLSTSGWDTSGESEAYSRPWLLQLLLPCRREVRPRRR